MTQIIYDKFILNASRPVSKLGTVDLKTWLSTITIIFTRILRYQFFAQLRMDPELLLTRYLTLNAVASGSLRINLAVQQRIMTGFILNYVSQAEYVSIEAKCIAKKLI